MAPIGTKRTCSYRAGRRINGRGSNRRWMKLQWQVNRIIGMLPLMMGAVSSWASSGYDLPEFIAAKGSSTRTPCNTYHNSTIENGRISLVNVSC